VPATFGFKLVYFIIKRALGETTVKVTKNKISSYNLVNLITCYLAQLYAYLNISFHFDFLKIISVQSLACLYSKFQMHFQIITQRKQILGTINLTFYYFAQYFIKSFGRFLACLFGYSSLLIFF